MSAFSRRVAQATGAPEAGLQRLSGGDLSEVLLVPRPSGETVVAKGGGSVATEAAMLRSIAAAGVPAPLVEGEHEGVLLLEHIENDRVFSAAAWADVGRVVRRLHAQTGEQYGWPVDYQIGTVQLDNRETEDWPAFWAERRLVAVAAVLDRPWRARIDALAERAHDLLPASPPPSLLHGDLWGGNILVRGGAVAALIDPACYRGHAEVDLAMLCLFDQPSPDFWDAYGHLEDGWRDRKPVYQLFPALLHLRLFGASYAGMVDRLLARCGA